MPRSQIANSSEGVSSRCAHLWTSRHQHVSLDACVTEAFARSGNAINHDAQRHRCNVKRCSHLPPPPPQPATDLRYNDVMYDLVVNGDDVTARDYRLTVIHGGWDVYAIIC